MSLRDIIPKEIDFLVKKALEELESVDSKIIPTYKMFVEKNSDFKMQELFRIRKKLPCPSHIPLL